MNVEKLKPFLDTMEHIENFFFNVIIRACDNMDNVEEDVGELVYAWTNLKTFNERLRKEV